MTGVLAPHHTDHLDLRRDHVESLRAVLTDAHPAGGRTHTACPAPAGRSLAPPAAATAPAPAQVPLLWPRPPLARRRRVRAPVPECRAQPQGCPRSGAPRLTVPATPAGGARQAGPSGAPEAAAAPQPTSGGAADGSDAAPVSPGASPAPKFARGGPADGTDAAPVPPATPPAPKLAGGVAPVHGAGGAPPGASPRFTRDAPRGPRRPPVRRPIPATVRRHVWLRDGGRCCYRDPLTGRRCNSSHLLQIDHLLPVADGGGPEPHNLAL